jgi:hypothetical protein
MYTTVISSQPHFFTIVSRGNKLQDGSILVGKKSRDRKTEKEAGNDW